MLTIGKTQVVEAPLGTPLQTVLDHCQVPPSPGVLVGGYHGMWLDPAGVSRRRAVARRDAAGRRDGGRRDHPAAHAGDLPARRGHPDRRVPGRAVGRAVRAVPARAARRGPVPERPDRGRGTVEASAAPRASAGAAAPAPIRTGRRSSCCRRWRRSPTTSTRTGGAAAAACRPTGSCRCRSPPARRAAVAIDWSRCDGHGLCAYIVPELDPARPVRLSRGARHRHSVLDGEGRAEGGRDVPRAGIARRRRGRRLTALTRCRPPFKGGWKKEKR